MSSPARKVINRIIPEFAKTVGDRVLFVGVHPKIDYSSYFRDFQTIDINPETNPNIVGDIQDCPEIGDKTYDAVIMIGVYEYLSNPYYAFHEINRILKYEGKALICLPGLAYHPNKPTVSAEIVSTVIKPLLIKNMEITYYQKNHRPYYFHIIARRT
jgi:ubiquinone/menaquinone biosynthesis C-methylase UbiE